MHICAGDIIRERTGRPLTLFQRMVVPVLARLIHEDEINAILKDYGHLPPYEFLRVVIHHVFGCSYTIYTACPLSALSRPPVFVSNHPLGGLDGIILLLALHDMGYNTRVIVNDLLMYVEPLRGLFVPVNKMGAQRRDYVRAMNELWRSDCPILTFPAGACSRLIDGRVQDLPWHESYLRLAERYNRPIVPIHFDGRNSMLFYRVAQLRRWLHIRFNIEMLLLPREMFRARGHHYHIQLSSPLNSKL